MLNFLVDENLSSLLSLYLRDLGYIAKSVREVGLTGESDKEVVKWAQKNNYLIITADMDFGEFFYWKTFGEIGVILLRSKYQSSKRFVEIIDYLDEQGVLKNEEISNALVVATNEKYRIRKFIE